APAPAAPAAAPAAAAPAPAPLPAPRYDPTPWGVIEMGTPPCAECNAAARGSVPPGEGGQPAPPRTGLKGVCDRVHGCLNRFGLCCWPHHNAFLCSSGKSEKPFIFGSCRDFFGETCLGRQQLEPHGVGALTVPSCSPSTCGLHR